MAAAGTCAARLPVTQAYIPGDLAGPAAAGVKAGLHGVERVQREIDGGARRVADAFLQIYCVNHPGAQ